MLMNTSASTNSLRRRLRARGKSPYNFSDMVLSQAFQPITMCIAIGYKGRESIISLLLDRAHDL